MCIRIDLSLPSACFGLMLTFPKRGGQGMNAITIHDNVQQLKFVCDDLNALRSVLLAVEDHEEYANEAVKVISRMLGSITSDIQESIDAIEGELRIEHVQRE